MVSPSWNSSWSQSSPVSVLSSATCCFRVCKSHPTRIMSQPSVGVTSWSSVLPRLPTTSGCSHDISERSAAEREVSLRSRLTFCRFAGCWSSVICSWDSRRMVRAVAVLLLLILPEYALAQRRPYGSECERWLQEQANAERTKKPRGRLEPPKDCGVTPPQLTQPSAP